MAGCGGSYNGGAGCGDPCKNGCCDIHQTTNTACRDQPLNQPVILSNTRLSNDQCVSQWDTFQSLILRDPASVNWLNGKITTSAQSAITVNITAEDDRAAVDADSPNPSIEVNQVAPYSFELRYTPKYFLGDTRFITLGPGPEIGDFFAKFTGGLGNVGSEYEGWAICDGSNGTPDMRGFVPMGYESLPPAQPFQTAGGTNVGMPTGITQPITLSPANLPAHVHTGNSLAFNGQALPNHTHSVSGGSVSLSGSISGSTIDPVNDDGSPSINDGRHDHMQFILELDEGETSNQFRRRSEDTSDQGTPPWPSSPPNTIVGEMGVQNLRNAYQHSYWENWNGVNDDPDPQYRGSSFVGPKQSGHVHDFQINDFSGVTGSVSASTTGNESPTLTPQGTITGNTGSVGSGTAFNVNFPDLPRVYGVYIRFMG